MLNFETRNRIIKYSDEFRKNMPVGINNSKSRLTGLYPDGHSLEITEIDGIFRVNLTINLNKHA